VSEAPPASRLPPLRETPARAEAGIGASAHGDAVAAVTSEMLLRGAGELLIDHHGTLYRLKKTSLGKLILTK
jgi:hemin uptake protein HemP